MYIYCLPILVCGSCNISLFSGLNWGYSVGLAGGRFAIFDSSISYHLILVITSIVRNLIPLLTIAVVIIMECVMFIICNAKCEVSSNFKIFFFGFE